MTTPVLKGQAYDTVHALFCGGGIEGTGPAWILTFG